MDIMSAQPAVTSQPQPAAIGFRSSFQQKLELYSLPQPVSSKAVGRHGLSKCKKRSHSVSQKAIIDISLHCTRPKLSLPYYGISSPSDPCMASLHCDWASLLASRFKRRNWADPVLMGRPGGGFNTGTSFCHLIVVPHATAGYSTRDAAPFSAAIDVDLSVETLEAMASVCFLEGLGEGEESPEVSELQRALLQLGYLSDASVVTGSFGPDTKNAVLDFQASHGVPETGYWGVLSRTAFCNLHRDLTAAALKQQQAQEGKVFAEAAASSRRAAAAAAMQPPTDIASTFAASVEAARPFGQHPINFAQAGPWAALVLLAGILGTFLVFFVKQLSGVFSPRRSRRRIRTDYGDLSTRKDAEEVPKKVPERTEVKAVIEETPVAAVEGGDSEGGRQVFGFGYVPGVLGPAEATLGHEDQAAEGNGSDAGELHLQMPALSVSLSLQEQAGAPQTPEATVPDLRDPEHGDDGEGGHGLSSSEPPASWPGDWHAAEGGWAWEADLAAVQEKAWRKHVSLDVLRASRHEAWSALAKNGMSHAGSREEGNSLGASPSARGPKPSGSAQPPRRDHQLLGAGMGVYRREGHAFEDTLGRGEVRGRGGTETGDSSVTETGPGHAGPSVRIVDGDTSEEDVPGRLKSGGEGAASVGSGPSPSGVAAAPLQRDGRPHRDKGGALHGRRVAGAREEREALLQSVRDMRSGAVQLDASNSQERRAARVLHEELHVLQGSHEVLMSTLKQNFRSSGAARAAAALVYQEWELHGPPGRVRELPKEAGSHTSTPGHELHMHAGARSRRQQSSS